MTTSDDERVLVRYHTATADVAFMEWVRQHYAGLEDIVVQNKGAVVELHDAFCAGRERERKDST